MIIFNFRQTKSMRSLIAAIILLVSWNTVAAQSYRFDQLNVAQGLSQNTVNAILKDHRGYIWVGTNDGLNQYNGYSFQVFRNKNTNANSLTSNKVLTLTEDQNGLLWIGTASGLCTYDPQQNQFIPVSLPGPAKKTNGGQYIRTVYEDRSGRIWAGTLDGRLCVKEKSSASFLKVRFSHLTVSDVSAICEDQSGTIWVGTDQAGLYYLEAGEEAWQFLPIGALKAKGDLAKSIVEDSMGRLWVGTQGEGLFRISADRSGIRHYNAEQTPGLQNNLVKGLTFGPHGNLWVATDGGGLSIFDLNKETVKHVGYDPYDPQSVASDAAYALFKDNEGLVWVGTFDGGVSIFNPNHKAFHHIGRSLVTGKGLNHRSVLSFLEDKHGDIWIGTDGGGLNIWTPGSGDFRSLGKADGVNSKVITSLCEDQAGQIWIGTYRGGLQRFNPKTRALESFQHQAGQQGSIRNDNVWSLLPHNENHLWVGTLAGLDRLNLVTGTFEHWTTKSQSGEEAYAERVTALYRGASGRVWVGGKGVRYVSKDSETLQPLVTPVSSSLNQFDSRAFLEDAKGRLWVGTEGGGLFVRSPDGLEIQNYTMADGLPSNAIHTLYEGEEGAVWMSTNKGLSRVWLEGKNGIPNFRNYCKQDGLQSNQFSYNAGLQTRGGHLYFGGINGFNYFNPYVIQDNPHAPEAAITGLKLYDQYVNPGGEDSPLTSPISQTEELVLSHQQSQLFALDFTALGYTSSEKNQYAYKLEGFLDEWSYIGDRRSVSFTNLNAGTYTFQVKAANNDGVWNSEPASLRIVIKPPFWRTPWAYASYVLISILLLFGFRHALLMRERLKNNLRLKDLERQKIEEVNRLKLAFFTNVSHEFRTPLTLITGPVEQLLDSGDFGGRARQHLQIVHQNTKRLLRLVNQLLEFRKIDEDQVRLSPQSADMVSFVKGVKTAFDGLAESRYIDYQLQASLQQISICFDPDKMEKIIYNLLSNAFKFTRRKVEIEIRKGQRVPESGKASQPVVLISIEDDGSGVSPQHQDRIFDRFYQVQPGHGQDGEELPQGTGIGLAYAKALVEMHGGGLELESTVGEGSRFTIWLPLDGQALGCSQQHQLAVTSPVSGEQPAGNDLQRAFSVPEALIQSGEKPTLLIVEDNEDVRRFLRMSFEPYFVIEEAGNGEAGITKALDLLPDIILSDIMMPKKSGIELCQTLKADDRTSHVPIVLLTANQSEEKLVVGLETGADDYVTKPFKFRLLKARVFNLIQNREILRRRFSQDLLQSGPKQPPSADEAFLQKAIQIVEDHLSDSEFGVSDFAKALGMSRSVLYRKFSALTDHSVKEFINMIRLKRATEMLKLGVYDSISEVAYSVGFSDAQYFSKKFKKHYNMTPTQYVSANEQDATANKGADGHL
jgi:signal transduction histidine kinase/ligand-binding sensor domain-containing protein/AraC-like DNA-binding protein